MWEVAAISLHDDVFPDSKEVTSERPIALQPTPIRWWEWLRALKVDTWQELHRVDRDAVDGRYGGRNALSGKRCSR